MVLPRSPRSTTLENSLGGLFRGREGIKRRMTVHVSRHLYPRPSLSWLGKNETKNRRAGHYLSTFMPHCHLRRRICVRSKVVKLIPTATGPLTQFMLSPLYRPRTSPSSWIISRMVWMMELYAWPITPAVCIRRRTTSRGYEADCPIRPAQAPKTSRSTG